MTTRRLPALLALALTFAAPALAEADTGTLSVQLGATGLDQADRSWHPTLRTDFAFDLVGPLQAGGYMQIMAAEVPLKSPGLGGGVLLALRPEIPVVHLRPLLELSGGRTQLTLAQNHKEVAWVTAAAVGLGVPIAQGAFFEARVTHQWFHQLPEDSALASRSWVVTGGLSFDIP
ncbi:MAG TPA: hypothetical protein RMH85_16240 [Polyangiaceae bacterium LLY-WYZ-15_(1-7)]|nr:hypothetical protein [Myxococcales bacterium]MAT29796.1 hypothetical protein [Sandaracinus sp.]HJK89790.1 hypothetical protein [Polyangiaceae bacterium LLY-WYZ-15_(1-7)]MBJ75205.1 hypothetical protein [Sandaracinus sp.]HJL01201.1 hypothetical protein [Polyangiaceae bacterium LLY-WYZ-15_(1-7)]